MMKPAAGIAAATDVSDSACAPVGHRRPTTLHVFYKFAPHGL